MQYLTASSMLRVTSTQLKPEERKTSKQGTSLPQGVICFEVLLYLQLRMCSRKPKGHLVTQCSYFDF